MHRLAVGICAVLAGCGRTGFDLIDASTEQSPIDTGAGCWAAWTSGPLRLATPQPLGEIATPEAHGDPSLSPDALALYFSRGSGAKDYYVARRPDRTSPWGTPTRIDDLSSPQDDTKLSLTGDGLVAILSSERSPATSADLWEATRAATTDAFGTASRAPFTALNDGDAQYDPHISADGLRLYYAPAVNSVQLVHLATRSSRTASFEAPVVLDLGQSYTADPSPSPDELVMVYASNMGGPSAMFAATRTGIAESFSAGQMLPLYDVPVHDQDPAISYDGCELFFASLRGGSPLQLYVTTVL